MTYTPLDGYETDASSPDADPLADFTSTEVSYDDAPDELTIYPCDVDDHVLLTTWITALDGSYHDLDSMR